MYRDTVFKLPQTYLGISVLLFLLTHQLTDTGTNMSAIKPILAEHLISSQERHIHIIDIEILQLQYESRL